MRSLLDNLSEATQKRTAIGHFNISDLVCSRRSKNPSLKRPDGPVAPE